MTWHFVCQVLQLHLCFTSSLLAVIRLIKFLVDFHSFLFSESEELSVVRVLVYRKVIAIPLIRGTLQPVMSLNCGQWVKLIG